MSRKNKFYVTTPIYYVNDVPHIGHTYTTVAADALARYRRMAGDRTFFSTGTDEHGAKIEAKAKDAGRKPREFTDDIAARFEETWKTFNISCDKFIRTTDPAHIAAVQNALQAMYDKGDIYPGTYEGLYCRGCEQYLNEKDLSDGKCGDHGTVPEKMSEECYMFRMSKYAKELLKKIKKDELAIMPEERKKEIVSFYENEGLRDVSFSRKNVRWGIELPWDAAQTAYVWSDAFLNYLTALGWNGDGNDAPDMWPPDVQLMSKDILRVHATIWPAMLLSLGLPMPAKLFIHGYFLVDGAKMSKSVGNVIAPDELVTKYGVDAARYLLVSSTPFGHDGDIGWGKFDEKYNADLANGLGNLAARVLSLSEKYCGGQVPEVDPKRSGDFVLRREQEGEIVKFGERVSACFKDYDAFFSSLAIDQALMQAITLVGDGDRHISATKLWKLAKENREEGAHHLYCLLELLRVVGWMLLPFMPETSAKLWQRLGLEPEKEAARKYTEAIRWGGLPPGIIIHKGEPLFPRK